jgi:hypothetical protein
MSPEQGKSLSRHHKRKGSFQNKSDTLAVAVAALSLNYLKVYKAATTLVFLFPSSFLFWTDNEFHDSFSNTRGACHCIKQKRNLQCSVTTQMKRTPNGHKLAN